MPNLHTHSLGFICIGVVKFCSLRGEGRRGWEARLKNGGKNETDDYIRLD